MDLHFLSEARKRSTRHRENQRARSQYLGRESATVGALGWRKRVVIIMRQLRMTTGQQRIAMSALGEVEKKHGVKYLNDQTTDALTKVLRAFQKSWKRSNIIPREQRRPGVSGVYHSSGVLRTRSGLERRGVTTSGRPATSKQLRLNLASLTTQKMTKGELEKHEHPDIGHLYGAIRQDISRFKRDTAVVWSADGKPYYILGQLTKPVHRTSMGKNDYDILIPRAMDHRGRRRKIRLAHLGDLHQWTKWRTMMRTQNMAKLPHRIPKKSTFSAFVKAAQEYAWDEAKAFYTTYENFVKGRNAVHAMRGMYQRPDGGHDKMTPEHRTVHDASYYYWKAHEDKLLGKMPEVEFADKKDKNALKAEMDKMGDSYTWFLWLLASEQQYGIQVAERRKLPENDRLPHTKNPVMGKPGHWAIQPTGREEVPRWDDEILKGIGYRPAVDFHRFEKELENSNYKLGAQGNKALTHLWVPLTSKLHTKYRLKALPSDISDYLEDAKREPTTQYLVGTMGNKLSVRHDKPITQFYFKAGTPRRMYSLIPAMGYLQFFDSPKHGGTRLVHGQPEYEQPAKAAVNKLDKPMSSRMRARSQHYLKTRFGTAPFAYDPEQAERDRAKIAADTAERMLKQTKADFLRRSEFLKRKRQRENIPAWQAPRRPIAGRFVRTARLRPIGKEGLMQDISGQWELPARGEIMPFRVRGRQLGTTWGSKVDPRTGERKTLRRQPHRKKFVVRGVGVTLAKPRVSPTRPELSGRTPEIYAPSWEEYWEDMKSRIKARPTVIDGKRYAIADMIKDEKEYKERYQQRLAAFIEQAHRRGYTVIDKTGKPLTSAK